MGCASSSDHLNASTPGREACYALPSKTLTGGSFAPTDADALATAANPSPLQLTRRHLALHRHHLDYERSSRGLYPHVTAVDLLADWFESLPPSASITTSRSTATRATSFEVVDIDETGWSASE